MKFHKLATLFPAMSDEDFEKLKNDIEQNGQLEPIVLHEGEILDGCNRYRVCTELDLEPSYVDFNNETSPLQYVLSKNLSRRHLTSSQKAAIAVDAEGIIEELESQAKERQGKRNDLQDNIVQTFAQSESPRQKVAQGTTDTDINIVAKLPQSRTRDKIADSFGTNHKYVEEAIKIKNIRPDLHTKIKAGELSIEKAKKEIKRYDKKKDIEENAKLPDSKFDVVYCDPPWSYSNNGLNGSAADHYNTMSTDDICKMEIKNLVRENAVMFMWATNPLLEDALRVVEAWGFKYKTNIVWVKNRGTYGNLATYVEGRHELLLICTKGSLTPLDKFKPDSVLEVSKGKHSKKPDEVYDIIEKMYPGTKKIELFARQKRETDNWYSFGNQIKNDKNQ